VDWIDLAQVITQIENSSECCSELLGSIKCWEVLGLSATPSREGLSLLSYVHALDLQHNNVRISTIQTYKRQYNFICHSSFIHTFKYLSIATFKSNSIICFTLDGK
jgi:hypothetical protein